MTGIIAKAIKGAACLGALAGCLYAGPAQAQPFVAGPVVVAAPRPEVVVPVGGWLGGPVYRAAPAWRAFPPVRFGPRHDGYRGFGRGFGWGPAHGARWHR